MNGGQTRTANGLDSFLAAFDNLSEADKAAALERIDKHRTAINFDQNSPEDSTPGQHSDYNAHSCHICQKLVVKENVRTLEYGDRLSTQDGYVLLTKSAILKGVGRGCVLTQWVLALLNNSLVKFKSDLDIRGVRLTRGSERDKIGSNADDLDYLSASGMVTVYLTVPKYRQAARLSLSYELNPLLIDRLWDATANKDKYGNDYKGFVAKYTPLTGTTFRIFTPQEDPVSTLVTSRPVTKVIDSEASFNLARRWLQKCNEEHEQCRKGDGLFPSRLIDIGTRFPIRFVRLYWPQDEERGEYAALSYCWGGSQTVATTTATAQDMTDGILLSKLPRTLQDAVNTTFKLGLRYLWVDCLCIIQDDMDDVAREISRMSEIFSEAVITISAASARSVQEGFLEPRRPLQEPPLKVGYESEIGVKGSIYVEQPRVFSPEEDPISLRAWTLQEHALSRRILMYSTREPWWTCEKSAFQDSGPTTDGTSAPRYLFRAGSRFSIDYWRSIVQDYTRRFLTYPSDKLPAIAGVAADYNKFFSGRYLAGLWEFVFVSELMWSSRRSDISRPAVQRAPSWSWAAVDGEISHDWCPLDGASTPLEILYCAVTPVSTSSPFGSVDPTRSKLEVRGEIGQFYWRENKQYIFVFEDRGENSVDSDWYGIF
jgi:hypothetical protein